MKQQSHTVTNGKAVLTDVMVAGEQSEAESLAFLILPKNSEHPLAEAIVEGRELLIDTRRLMEKGATSIILALFLFLHLLIRQSVNLTV